ncbi:MAG: very short patch repair endonuclease [candidate division Zixibacteria bacterium]|nr:very short patch repair endonuclease [candidate division Zixibacteria bacterium]
MPDVFTQLKRSKIMASIKGRDTVPEKKIRSIVHRMGYRYSLHDKELPGCPDIVLNKYRKIIFVNGCFWHGHGACKRSARPLTNRKFWNSKIDSNIIRDKKFRRQLRSNGWKVLTIWQCEINNSQKVYKKLYAFLQKT